MSTKPTYADLEKRVAELERIVERHRSEVAGHRLQERESRYRAFFENSLDGIVILDPETARPMEFNDQACRQLGYSREEFARLTVSDIEVDETAEETLRHIRKVMAEGHDAFETRQRAKTGETRNVHVTAQVIDVDGRPLYYCIWRDITEQKRAETALRESEKFLNAIVENIPDMIFVKDAKELRFVRFNKAGEDLLGYSREELHGKNDYDFFPEAEADFFTSKDRDVLRSGKPLDIPEEPVQTKHKGERILRTQKIPLLDVNGDPAYLLGISEDITEGKQAEQTIQQSEKRFRDHFRNNPVPIFRWKRHGEDFVLIDWNQAASEIAKGKLDSIAGITAKELYGSEQGFLVENLERCYSTHQPVHSEFPYSMKTTGERKWIRGTWIYVEPDTVMMHTEDTSERKQAELALKEALLRQREAVKAGNVGLWDWDLKTDKVRYSAEWKHQIGYEEDEIGDGFDEWQSRVHPDDLPRTLGRVKQMIRSRTEAYQVEFRFRHKDGSYRWILAQATVLTDENGEPVRTLGSHVDITERKQAENALRKSETLFQTMLAAIPDMISIHDTEMNVVYSNWNGFAAVPPDRRIPGEKCYRIYRGHDKVCPDCRAKRVIETRKPYAEEVELPEGGWYELNVIPILDADGKCERFVEWVRDITERKRAEKELIRKQRFLDLHNRIVTVFLNHPRTDMESAPLTALDDILRILDSRFGYFGYIDEAGDLICPSMTRDVWDQCQVAEKSIVFPRAGWGGLWGRSLLEKRTLVANENLRLPEGHVALENALAAPIVHQDTLIGQFVVANKAGGYDQEDRELLEAAAAHTAPILFGIQEEARQKTVHEKLEAQLRQAQKMEAVGRLAGGVAHDFNNMLSIIIGHADMILDEMEPDQPFYADLMEIRQAGERSADLTRQLLAFARKQTVSPKVIDLDKTVEGMLKMVRRLIGEDIDTAWIPGGNVWPVKIDPGQIDQILANLCVNARDAIAGVGKMTIETGNTVFDEDYCRDHEGVAPGEYAMLAVSDDGRGMDAETLSHLFEPFFTTKGPGKGTGLGLATVYGVVKQNNGFINVRSEPGQGTTFKIYLPRHKTKTATLPEKGPDRPSERGRETVLLVEDEPAILRMTAMMLERQGYKVVGASTPGEAIRLATEHAGDIHLLMTDVVMPEMNGRDLAKNILALYPRLKCLFMSGYTANVIAHCGVLDDGVNFIEKPFSKDKLGAKVREALDGKTAGGSSDES